MKIDFKHFKMYTDIAHKNAVTLDAQEQIANTLYTGVNGIAAHALAFKIYNAKKAEDYNDDEIKILKTAINAMCIASFIDSFNELITPKK